MRLFRLTFTCRIALAHWRSITSSTLILAVFILQEYLVLPIEPASKQLRLYITYLVRRMYVLETRN